MSPDDIHHAAKLWRAGMDTRSIAYMMQVREHHVYNVIDRIKARAKRMPYPKTAPDQSSGADHR